MAKFERIIPILVYDDIPSAHDFLVDAFGFAPAGVQRTLTAWRFTEKFASAIS